MSEQATEQQDEQTAEATTFPVELVLRETGRTHNVTGSGLQPITDDAGNAEQEYALVATVDGVPITLSTLNYGRVQTQVIAAKAAQQQQAG